MSLLIQLSHFMRYRHQDDQNIDGVFQLHPLAPNIFFCFSNYQGIVFFFLLLSTPINDIVKKAISSQNMTNPIGSST